MIKMNTYRISRNLIAVIVMAFICGCAVNDRILNDESQTANAGLKLWAQKCARCHNVPSPTDFSDHEWEVIGLHMRVRAYLTGKETEAIIRFLKSTNG
jgi:hypothetical protein